MRALARVAIVGAALAVATPSIAAPTPEDLETARELVKQGREARARGDLSGALEKFKAAHAAGQTPVTGIELARTYAAVGQLVEAREVALSIGRTPVAPDETQRSAEARADAAKLAEEVRPRIPSITVKVEKPPTDALVAIDGETLPAALIGEPRKVNPGTHTITMMSGGRTIASTNVDVREGESRVVALAPNLTQSGGFTPPAHPPTGAVPAPLSPPGSRTSEGVPDNMVLGAAFAVVPHLFLLANENPESAGYKPIMGVTAGMTFEAGGAISSDFDVMLRGLVTFGDRGKPSYILGAGPAFSYAATPWLWIGASLLAGRGETKFNGLPYSTDWVLAGSAEVSFAVYRRSHGQWLLSFLPGYYFVNERADNPLFFFPVTFGYRSY